MIVPSMSLPEIRKSVLADFDGEIKSKLHSLDITYQGKWLRNGRKDFVETISYRVKSRNNWRITVSCGAMGVNTVPYLISYNNIGVTASHIPIELESTLMHFNTHFFKRYKERAKISIEKPEDLVKFFFRKNILFVPCFYPRKDGTYQLFTPLDGGVGLGIYYKELGVCEYKTFVNYDLLREEQKEEIRRIWNKTMQALTDEINIRMNRRSPYSRGLC